MSAAKWRGFAALLQDAVEHGSRAVERVHLETAARPFSLLEKLPGLAAPSRVVHLAHDAVAKTSYGSVRVVNGAARWALDAVLGALEAKRAD